MNKIDKKACTKCYICQNECLNQVITAEKGDFPVISQPEFCIGCGHCMAKCPAEAIRIRDLDPDKFRTIPKEPLVDSESMSLFLQTKRSCRKYSSAQIKKSDLDELLNSAQIAPTAINCQEKTFIVIQDQKLIKAIGDAVIRKSRKLVQRFRLLTKSFLINMMPPESAAYFKSLVHDYEGLIQNHDAGKDHLFYNAPCLVLFTGIKMDPAGKDHALHAMNYFMLQAHSMGIGTCINGFSQIMPKILARFVKVPELYQIFGVITAGYEGSSFKKSIFRKKPEIAWYG